MMSRESLNGWEKNWREEKFFTSFSDLKVRPVNPWVSEVDWDKKYVVFAPPFSAIFVQRDYKNAKWWLL